MPPAGSRHSNRAMPKHGDARFMARPPLIPAAILGEPGARRHTAEDILVSPQDGRGNDGGSRPQGRPSGPASPQPRIPALQLGPLARRPTRLTPVAHPERAEARGEGAPDGPAG